MPILKLLLAAFVLYALIVVGLIDDGKYVFPADQLIDFASVDLPLAFAGTEERYAYVTVMIEDTPLRLMIDTGHFAPISISTEVLDTLAVKFIGARIHRDADGNLYRSREFIVPTLRLGELELQDVPGIENHTSPFDDDGTVGDGLLRYFNVVFNYQGKTLTLYRNDHYPEIIDEPGWSVFPLISPPQFAVQFDGLDQTYRIGLDSGCGYTTVPKASPLGCALCAAFGEGEDHRVADGRTGAACYLYELDRCLFDGVYDLGPTTCVVSDMPGFMGNGLLGYDVFWNNTVFFDNAKGEVWLRPARQP